MHAPASPVVTADFQVQAHCGRLFCSGRKPCISTRAKSDQGLVRGSTRTQALSPATSNNAKRRASFWVRNTPPISPSLSFATQYPRAFSAISKWCGENTARGARWEWLSCQYCYSSCSYEQADIIGLTPLGFERPLKGL